MLMDLWYIFIVRSDTLVIQIQLPVCKDNQIYNTSISLVS